MKQFLVVVVTVLTSLSPIRANLGDGGDRIDDAYGNLVERHLRDDGTVSVLYHKDRYLYFANAAGATWSPGNKGKERRFKRSDGKAAATYATMDSRPTLTVRELDTRR